MTNTKTFGYVRVSTKDQNTDRQLVEMQKLNINERDIFIDKASGKDFDRPQYQALKVQLRAGDLLYITSLDRLGRNSDAIKKEWNELTQVIGADIIVIDMPLLDTRKYKDTMGNFVANLVLEVLTFMAQSEREKTLARQAEGIAVAKAKGKHLGRPQLNLNTLTKQQRVDLEANYQAWKVKKITGVKYMEKLGLKKNSFYKIISEYENSIEA
ncbi:DNA recombinase [Lysinibacillus sp. FJAT-14745]|uniref:recombinase family protein n=1 Tax=Lysinibacillus sp. FJAT-14745 TaxID=1704289 RepID=UPI0006ABD522|nr:recombinase family protein [Lysinibacillus sp. FJAT-14745]KOP80651.1 DNA recombinase [Lysinibacillus sp. FJAT-14745]